MGSIPVAGPTSTASGVFATGSRLRIWAPEAVLRHRPLACPAAILICSISRFDIAPLAGGKYGRDRVTEAGSQEGREDLYRDGEEGSPPEALSRAGPRVERSRGDRGEDLLSGHQRGRADARPGPRVDRGAQADQDGPVGPGEDGQDHRGLGRRSQGAQGGRDAP